MTCVQFSSLFLCLMNELIISPPKDIYEKGGLALIWTISKPTKVEALVVDHLRNLEANGEEYEVVEIFNM